MTKENKNKESWIKLKRKWFIIDENGNIIDKYRTKYSAEVSIPRKRIHKSERLKVVHLDKYEEELDKIEERKTKKWWEVSP